MKKNKKKCIIRILVIIFVLISMFFIFFVSKYSKETALEQANRYITQAEWFELLRESFGEAKVEETSEQIVTGKYAAITVMKMFSEERLEYLTEKKITDKVLLTLAKEYKIIGSEQIKQKLTKEMAEQIIENALDVYYAPENYPQYFEVETKRDCIDADRWEISEIDENNLKMIAKPDKAPEEGEVLIYTDEFGIAHACKIEKTNQLEDGQIALQLATVEDISEILESISFSGNADFSYLLGKNDNNKILERTDVSKKKSSVITAYADLLEWEWFDDKTAIKRERIPDNEVAKCDIDIKIKTKDVEKNGKLKQTLESSVQIKDDVATKTINLVIDDTGKKTSPGSIPDTLVNLTELDFDKLEGKAEVLDTSYSKDEFGTTAQIEIEGFSVCTSGYFQWSDPNDKKNYVEVIVSADKVTISQSAKISGETKWEIADIELPVTVTGGTVVIKIKFYVVASASGEIELWYEVEKPSVEMEVSTARGMETIFVRKNDSAGFQAKIDMSAGLISEAAITVFNKVLANPGIDGRIYGELSTVNLTSKYEMLPEYKGTVCFAMKAQAPIIKFKATAGEESVLGLILKALGKKGEIDLIEKDSDKVPWKETYHVEQNAEGKFVFIPLGKQTHEDVCTHIQKKQEQQRQDKQENVTINQKGDSIPDSESSVNSNQENEIIHTGGDVDIGATEEIGDKQVQEIFESEGILLSTSDFDKMWSAEIRPGQESVETNFSLDMVFVLDYSHSMNENDSKGTCKDLIKEIISNLNGETERAAIVKFIAKASLVNKLTTDKEKLMKAVDNIVYDNGFGVNSGTNGSAGLRLALDELKDSKASEKYIFFLTDGEDSEKSYFYEELSYEAKERGIVIYTIGIGNASEKVLMQIAGGTKGKYYYITLE